MHHLNFNDSSICLFFKPENETGKDFLNPATNQILKLIILNSCNDTVKE